MNTSWGWIKQRPHFFAEGLSKKYDTVVLTKLTKRDLSNKICEVRLKFLYRLPYERFPIVFYINNVIYGLQFWFYSLNKDLIWLSSPLDYLFAKHLLSNKIVIYDCMDDQVELQNNGWQKKITERVEKDLCKRANIVISSSKHLSGVLQTKYGVRDIFVINNALADNFNVNKTNSKMFIKNDDYIHITYIGTISSWFDFELLLKIVERFPFICFDLFGPLDVKVRPDNDRVVFHGPISHDDVYSVMQQSDALIMPFIVNNLIKSVNPVKLYEYIFSGKPCFAPYYDESSLFKDYVYLYNNEDEIFSFVENISKGNNIAKKNIEECRKFAMNNTWSSRISYLEEIINHYIKCQKQE